LAEARNGFGKSYRLLRPADFQHVFQGGRRRSAGNLAVYWRPNRLAHPRIGIAISRKCTRSAVIRNRIKRVVREAFRVRKERLGGVDIVFLAHAGAATHDTKQLRAIVDSHLAELEVCERS
jgi:ribonuclease P protein component